MCSSDLKGDVLVLSGSIPASIDSRIYESILARLDGKGVLAVVDAEKDLLLNVLKFRPFLIKPNNHELGDMFGVALKTQDDIIRYAKRLQQMGARNVLVSWPATVHCCLRSPARHINKG